MKTILSALLLLCACSLQAQTDSTKSNPSLSDLPLENLMNITVITAARTEQTTDEAPATVTVVTAQQIRERGYEQLEDVLRDLPGVDLVHVYGTFPTIITFRGMYGDENRRVLLMIDGRVENSLIGGSEMAGPAYPLHNVLRIEIIWGPGSALYGANAYGGVINIITQKGSDNHQLTYERGYGSFNTSVERLYAGYQKDKWEMAVACSLYRTDGPVFTNRSPDFSAAYVDRAWSFNGHLSYTFKKGVTTLGFTAFNTPMGTGTENNAPTQLLDLPQSGKQNTGVAGILPQNIRGEKPGLWQPYSRNVYLQHEYKPTTKWSFFARLQYRETGLSDQSYYYSTDPSTGNQVLRRYIFAHASNRAEGELSATFSPTAHQQLTGGVDYYHDNLERGYRGVNLDPVVDTIEGLPVSNLHASFKPRDYTIQHHIGAYAQYILNTNLLGKTNLTAGIRYDNNSIYGNTVNPRISLVNQGLKNLTIKLLFGSAFRQPSNFELYAAAGARIPNPDLTPEKVKTYELNLLYTVSSQCRVQVNLFNNRLTDLIIQGVPIGNGNFQNQNVGSATIRGLEAKLDVAPSPLFSGFLNFTWQQGTEHNGRIEFDMPNIAKVKGNIGLVYRPAGMFSISVIGNWVGNRTVATTNPLGQVSGYFATNLVFCANELFDNRVSVSLNIRNVFNENYDDPGIRQSDGNRLGTVHEQPGRNGFFKVGVRLF